MVSEQLFSKKIRNANWKDIPFELVAYLVFVIVVTIADFITTFLGPQKIREILVPITGWNMSTCYMYSIFFVIYLCIQPNITTRNTLLHFLSLQIVLGLVDLFMPHGDGFGNPYLMVSPWRPIWTILIPVIWFIALFSPRIKRFCLKYTESI